MSALRSAAARRSVVVLLGTAAAASGCENTKVWLSLSRVDGVASDVRVEVSLDGTLAKTYTNIPVDPPAVKRIDIGRSAAVVQIEERALVGDGADVIVVARTSAEWTGGTFVWTVGAPAGPSILGGGGGAGGDGGDAGADGPGGAGGGGAGGSGGCPGDAAVTHTCAEYCALVSNNSLCGVLYPDGDCLATCESFGWPSNNMVADGRENTLECRIARLGLGCTSPGNIGGASAVGGQICPANQCVGYCDAVDRNCAGAPHPYAGSRADCMDACRAFGWKLDDEGILVATGAGLDCYLYWAGQAGRAASAGDEGARATACLNAGPNSAKCVHINP